jgi:hypothetical protein
MEEKTHYRKAFNSPYLSAADIVGSTVLTISHVRLEQDQTKKTKDYFNTAYFVEKEIRKGEVLKPMILNAHNSRVVRDLTGSHFIEDWNDLPVSLYVDSNVRFGRDTVEGLRISPEPPRASRRVVTPEDSKLWDGAKAAYMRDGNLEKVLEKADMSESHQSQLRAECD